MKWLLIFGVIVLSGCISNSPFRSGDGENCPDHHDGCGSYYESHGKFDVGFVEFTERGNDFNPEQTKKLLESIEQQSRSGNLAVVVFVHGWNHNASTKDSNVLSFTHALGEIQSKGVVGNKKLIGVYVGWRGKSFNGLGTEILSFWERKRTAEEVGRGGVTRFLLDLEYISKRKPENFMLTIGHSFGAAITLSALHDVLLEKMIAAERGEALVSFGDGIVLLNPAIEANQVLLLKESSMRLGAKKITMPSLMNIISSRADTATNWAFPIGQFLGVTLLWKQVSLQRTYQGRSYSFNEVGLDQETVGNYGRFTTSVMDDQAIEQSVPGNVSLNTRFAAIKPVKDLGGYGKWGVTSNCAESLWSAEIFPCFENDPIDFMSVPKSFIGSHGDIYNEGVKALLSVVVEESYSRRSVNAKAPNFCSDSKGGFSFGECFSNYYALYKGSGTRSDLLKLNKP